MEEKPAGAQPGMPRVGRRRLVGLASWLVFGAAWWRVAQQQAQVDLRVLTGLVGTASAALLITLLWVWWNARIYRAKGPRRQVAVSRRSYDSDSLSRTLRISPAACEAAVVEVSVTRDGSKSYTPRAHP